MVIIISTLDAFHSIWKRTNDRAENCPKDPSREDARDVPFRQSIVSLLPLPCAIFSRILSFLSAEDSPRASLYRIANFLGRFSFGRRVLANARDSGGPSCINVRSRKSWIGDSGGGQPSVSRFNLTGVRQGEAGRA